ncbi:hypothetical protein P9302_08335 [Brevibacillus agri]|uniref:hypothetical protein n=1 Tax=Brevibacillus agri TaxID=51101 RepID=UPI002E2105B3|nr:hypothetical protein [Brevibacillus agri]
MNIDEHILLWNQASIDIVHIQHQVLKPGKPPLPIQAAVQQLPVHHLRRPCFTSSDRCTQNGYSPTRKEEKSAKLFGIPTEAEGKKRNTLFASNSEKLPESTTFGRGFAFSPEPGSESPSRDPKKLPRFLFPRLRESRDDAKNKSIEQRQT